MGTHDQPHGKQGLNSFDHPSWYYITLSTESCVEKVLKRISTINLPSDDNEKNTSFQWLVTVEYIYFVEKVFWRISTINPPSDGRGEI